MTTTASDAAANTSTSDDSIRASLGQLEGLLDRDSGRMFEPEFIEELGKELGRLHARLRVRHAAAYVDTSAERNEVMPPELADELTRLRSEHPVILGQLDRLIRCLDSIADRTLEDKEVFLLRGRELIAILRRHEAEEDRLFYLAVWRDMGGES